MPAAELLSKQHEGRGRGASPPLISFLSLDSRLGMLRRRRRRTFLKRLLAAMAPVLAGMSLLLLVAFETMATLR